MRVAEFFSLAALASLAGGILLADPVRTVEAVVLAVLMGIIADEDRKRFQVPAWANASAALVGMIVVIEISISENQDISAGIVAALGSGIVCGASLLAVRELFFQVRGVDGLGFGDVKLGATAGIWLGWEMFCYAIMLSAIGCLLVVALSHVRKRGWSRQRRIPFALALAPSIWLCWIVLQVGRLETPRALSWASVHAASPMV